MTNATEALADKAWRDAYHPLNCPAGIRSHLDKAEAALKAGNRHDFVLAIRCLKAYLRPLEACTEDFPSFCPTRLRDL